MASVAFELVTLRSQNLLTVIKFYTSFLSLFHFGIEPMTTRSSLALKERQHGTIEQVHHCGTQSGIDSRYVAIDVAMVT